MLGVLMILVITKLDNIQHSPYSCWIKEGGGIFGHHHPPAKRFNAGQKIVFWTVVLGGLGLSISGIMMLFPFSAADINGMQWAQYAHASIGIIMIAAIIAHIYIGTLGMEGAYDAMGSG